LVSRRRRRLEDLKKSLGLEAKVLVMTEWSWKKGLVDSTANKSVKIPLGSLYDYEKN
jgi:hypothetical protein